MRYKKINNELRWLTDISLGIYADAEGFSISVVAIEEKPLLKDPYDTNPNYAYRYWLLDQVYNSRISHVQIRQHIYKITQEYEYIDSIFTNEKTLIPILKDSYKVDIMDLAHVNLITLIRSLSHDYKLEIANTIKQFIVPVLDNYDPEEINYVALSLYLGLNYKIEKVINSHSIKSNDAKIPPI